MAIFYLFFLSSSIFAQPQSLVTVSSQTFAEGDTWTWAYSAWDKLQQNWQSPYFFEKYTVTDVAGDLITIEMASGSRMPVATPAHHKFIADLKTCLESSDLKTWTIQLYTKSFGSGWVAADLKNKGLAFTEKFNCTSVAEATEVQFQELTFSNGSTVQLISIPDPNEPASWYIQNHFELDGVAYLKYFETGYKFELVNEPSSPFPEGVLVISEDK